MFRFLVIFLTLFFATAPTLACMSRGYLTKDQLACADRTLPQYPRPEIVSDNELKRIVYDTIKQETISYIEKHKKWPRQEYTINIEPRVKRFFKVIVTHTKINTASNSLQSKQPFIFLDFDYDKAIITRKIGRP